MGLDHQLDGLTALVTGAGQGVGAGIAGALAAGGASVVVNDLDRERADAVVAEIVADGGSAVVAPFDVTDHEAAAGSISQLGRVDILVNNAGNAGAEGFGALGRFADTSPRDWRPFVDVNLYGVLNCTHAVLPGMVEAGWGRVVTVVSDAARSPAPGTAVYGAAKAAAAAFGRNLAAEVARHGITVNNVALGTMRTPLTAGLWDDAGMADQQKAILSGYMVRRPGDPADAAWMVAALVSPRAAWVTGQTIPVDGGFAPAL